MNGLNKGQVFQGVYYSQTLNALNYTQSDRYLRLTGEVVEGLSAIKQNGPYSRFIGQETGIDMSKSFATMEKTPLVLASYPASVASAGMRYFHDFYAFEVNLPPRDLYQNQSDSDLSYTIGHEIGHHLSLAARYLQGRDHMTRQGPSPGYKLDDFKANWQEEFNADKISRAINLDRHTVRAPNRKSFAWTNSYEAGLMPRPIADVVSAFCMTRDSLLSKTLNPKHTPLSPLHHAQVTQICHMSDMFPSYTHPPLITRAVESDKFAQRARHFLKKNTP